MIFLVLVRASVAFPLRSIPEGEIFEAISAINAFV